MTVLVTGGAGYIGSHTVHELVDAGESVVVLDNLSTGFRSALPKPMLPIVGDVGDQALVASVIETHRVDAIIHFAGSIVVPESVARSARLLPQQHGQLAQPDGNRGQVRRAAFHLLLDRRGVRRSGARAGRRGCAAQSGVALRLVEADDRGDAARRAAAHGLGHVILRYFNVAGADPKMRTGQSTPEATHLIKVAVADRARHAQGPRRVRHRLPDAGRHLHPRLHPRHRSRARASRRADLSARRRRQRHAATAATAAAIRCCKWSTR